MNALLNLANPSSTMANNTPIAPAPAPIGLNPNFMANAPTILVLRERLSFSGDDFTIQTAQGQDVIRVNGRYMSMSGRKEFMTPNGEVLFALRKELISFPKSWFLESPAGEKICVLEGRFSIGKAKLDIKFKNALGGGQDVMLEARGSFADRTADITWDGVVICKIRRDFLNFGQIFGDRQTYGVEVAPGVDLALMAAIAIGIDEQVNDKKR